MTIDDAVSIAVEALQDGGAMTAGEVWEATGLPWPGRDSATVLDLAVERGLVLRIDGHRHNFNIQPMPCFVSAVCAGPVCQCKRGADWLAARSSQPHLHRVTVYQARTP